MIDSPPSPDSRAGTSPPDKEMSQPGDMLQRIVDALEAIRAEEFDYEILRAASEVMGEDAFETWRPSLSYLPPEKRGEEYHVTVYAQGACQACPVKRQHVDSIEPKVRALVGSDAVFVHDYFDMFDFGSRMNGPDG